MDRRGQIANRAVRLRNLGITVPLLCASCAGLARNDQGTLQPQTVRGPCDVKKFFVLSQTSVHTDMTIGNAGQPCTFTMFNPDLQLTLAAALVTSQAAHGHASAVLTNYDRQAIISYAPQPGYNGPDSFSITLEPNDLGVTVAVRVQPAPPAS